MQFDNDKPLLVNCAFRVDIPVQEKDKYGYPTVKSSGGLTTTLEGLKAPEIQDNYNRVVFGANQKTVARPEDRYITEKLDEKTGIWYATVTLTHEEKQNTYCNELNKGYWFGNHDLIELASFQPGGSKAVESMNEVVAVAMKDTLPIEKGTKIVVHDYHLPWVGKHLKNLGCESDNSFMLHTPLMSPETGDEAEAKGVCKKRSFFNNFVAPLYDYNAGVFVQRGWDAEKFASWGISPKDQQFFKPYEQNVIYGYTEEGLKSVPVTVNPVGPDVDDVRRTAKAFADHPTVKDFEKQYAKPDMTTFVLAGRLDPMKNHDGFFDGVEYIMDHSPEDLKGARFAIIGPDTRVGIGEYDAYSAKVKDQFNRINAKFESLGMASKEDPAIRQWGEQNEKGDWLGVDREVLLGINGTAGKIAKAGGKFVSVVHSRFDGQNLVILEAECADEHVLGMVSYNAGAHDKLESSAIVSYHTNAKDIAHKQLAVEETAHNILKAKNMPMEEVVARNNRAIEKIHQYSSQLWMPTLIGAGPGKNKPNYFQAR